MNFLNDGERLNWMYWIVCSRKQIMVLRLHGTDPGCAVLSSQLLGKPRPRCLRPGGDWSSRNCMVRLGCIPDSNKSSRQRRLFAIGFLCHSLHIF